MSPTVCGLLPAVVVVHGKGHELGGLLVAFGALCALGFILLCVGALLG